MELEGDFLKVQAVLPKQARGKTQGLFGNFNSDDSDDFTAADGSVIASDAGIVSIHTDFGMTCEYTTNM